MIERRLEAAGLPPLPRRAWLEIDTDALAGNLQAVRTLVGPQVQIAAVVKADGYGHGIEVAARSFVAGGADRLCVASIDEAIRLRAAGIEQPLLVLFAIPSTEVVAAADAGIALVASDARSCRELVAAWSERRGGARPGTELELHVEVETGLGRAGLDARDVPETVAALRRTPGVRLGGLWSHLASPDDPVASARQEERLQGAIEGLRSAGEAVPPVHLSATGGLFAGTHTQEAMVRPGLCLYGELPDDLAIAEGARAAADALRPAMTLKARPIRVNTIASGTSVGYGGRWTAQRPSRIATLPVGYGDGWTRTYQPGSEALVRGRRVPLVGSVAMDAVAADVTDVPGVDLDDEFVLLGAQDGERITAMELARRRTTIAWEVVTAMAARLPRVYHAGSGVTGVRTLGGEILVGGSYPSPETAREAAGR